METHESMCAHRGISRGLHPHKYKYCSLSPQGVNINICPCHTHKGEGSRFVWASVRWDVRRRWWKKCKNFLDLSFKKKKLPKLWGFHNPDFWQTFSALSEAGEATQLPSTQQFEQSVKGKKEINSTLTNVNKVLSGQQRRIDSIKRANVPLACLSFNYITESLLHILPRGQPILHHICVHMSSGSHVWVCVCACIITCLGVCGFHVCLWTASLYIYWNEQLSLGRLCGAEACSHASIYRLPRIKAWLRQPFPLWPRRGDPQPRQSSGGEKRVSSPGRRLGALPLPAETWKVWNDTASLCTCTRTHTQTVTSNRLRFVQAQTPIRTNVSHVTGRRISVVWYHRNTSKDKVAV